MFVFKIYLPKKDGFTINASVNQERIRIHNRKKWKLATMSADPISQPDLEVGWTGSNQGTQPIPHILINKLGEFRSMYRWLSMPSPIAFIFNNFTNGASILCSQACVCFSLICFGCSFFFLLLMLHGIWDWIWWVSYLIVLPSWQKKKALLPRYVITQAFLCDGNEEYW